MATRSALPANIVVHTAIPLIYPEDDTAQWVEGEPGAGPEPAPGVPFACVLLLPSPGGDQPNAYRPRVVRTPTLLYNPRREITRRSTPPVPALVADRSAIDLGNEDELLVNAPELAPWTGGETVRWQMDGAPQPFGPPGTVLGIMATVRQVKD